jgi:fructokinase
MALDVLAGASRPYEALGGSAGNVLAILAYLGWQAIPVVRLGRDPAGERILSEFAALGAKTTYVRSDATAHTPVVYQWLAHGQPRYSLACPVCGQKGTTQVGEWTDLAADVLSTAPVPSVFYFDRPTPLNRELARHFRSQGALVVFEPSKAAKSPEFHECVRLSNVVKYAADRIQDLEADGDYLEVRTMSADGLAYRMPGNARWSHLPSIAAPLVADSSGSGDWCTAGALYWFLKEVRNGAPIHSQVRSALRFGQALAALNCMYEGARALAHSVPSSKLLEVAEHLSRLEQDIADELMGVPAPTFWSDYEQVGTPRQALCCQHLSR